MPPSICFVLAKPSKKENGKEKQAPIKITLSVGVKNTFQEFNGGKPDDFMDLINQHNDPLKDLKLKENCKVSKKAKFEKEHKLVKIRDKKYGGSCQAQVRIG